MPRKKKKALKRKSWKRERRTSDSLPLPEIAWRSSPMTTTLKEPLSQPELLQGRLGDLLTQVQVTSGRLKKVAHHLYGTPDPSGTNSAPTPIASSLLETINQIERAVGELLDTTRLLEQGD